MKLIDGVKFRRRHDKQIQDRIRQITDRMLRRRLEARSSLFEEKRQVRLELREVRKNLPSHPLFIHFFSDSSIRIRCSQSQSIKITKEIFINTHRLYIVKAKKNKNNKCILFYI